MDKKLVGLITVFFLVFGVFMSFLVFGRNAPVNIQANTNIQKCDNSFIFVNDVSLPVGSTAAFVAYVRNSEGAGLSKIAVTCTTTLGTILPSNESVTANSGSATFTLTSDTAGIATISCSTPSCSSFAKNVTIQFR